MDMFKHKVAIITGGASGIGRAVAELLADRGAIVILADRNGELAEETSKAIAGRGGKARPYPVEVTDRETVQRMVRDTVKEYGRLDYLFNNAGTAVGGEAHEFEYDDWKTVIDVNLYGVVNGVVAVYPVMIEQGFGHIVNTASVAGLIPTPGEVSYAASKYAVVGLSHALRIEAEHFGVKVSVVCPGVVNTPLLQTGKVIKHDREKMVGLLPNPISPEKMARAVLRGVAKNQRTIIAPFSLRVAWFFYRLSPGPFFFLARFMMKKIHEARIK